MHARADNNQDGTLTVEGTAYPVRLLNIPTVVEAYKTYDDVNLVKINDVGQVGVRASIGGEQVKAIRAWCCLLWTWRWQSSMYVCVAAPACRFFWLGARTANCLLGRR
jgi:hypothetical protein